MMPTNDTTNTNELLLWLLLVGHGPASSELFVTGTFSCGLPDGLLSLHRFFIYGERSFSFGATLLFLLVIYQRTGAPSIASFRGLRLLEWTVDGIVRVSYHIPHYHYEPFL